jgi:hypothetical protein
MADFRKWILALSVLALVFTGVAGAQVVNPNGGSAGIVCNTTSAPLTLRNEGYTELIGDIVLTCTGGSLQAVGSVIQPVNVTVQLPYTVTSREIPFGAKGVNGNASEALLMLDEPGTTQGGFGPQAPQQLCETPLSGCEAWVADNGTYYFAANKAGTAVAPNVYAGVTGTELGTNPSQVTFFGVPLLAPVTTTPVEYSRIIRITNVRMNAQGAVGGGTSYQSVTAQVSINNSNITVNNSAPIVGYQQQSLLGTFRDNNNKAVSVTALPQCFAETNYAVAYLRYSELFGDAFKTRVAGNVNNTSATPNPNSEGQYPATVTFPPPYQNVPGGVGTVYGYSESDFFSSFPGTGSDALAGAGAVYCGDGVTGGVCSSAGPFTTSQGYMIGVADYGTRLKAVFNNIPSGVSVYVAAINENDGLTTGWNLASPEPWGNYPAGDNAALTANLSPELAYLVTSETAVDAAASIPAATATQTVIPLNALPNTTVAVPMFQVDNIASPKAVWEVIQALSNNQENFDFGVYVTYPTGLPPQTGITATMSYAPTPTAANITAYAGDSASLTIPRFAPNPANPNTPYLFAIAACNTVLLFPYVTTAGYVEGVSGFDTGISIANTSADPFNTPTSSGLCNLYWYGNIPVDSITAPPATYPLQTVLGAGGPGSSVPIFPGTIAVTEAGGDKNVPSGWSGYMIASCNFQFAHGYAVVSDIGVRNIMSSYLALVVTNPGSSAPRGPNFVGFSNSEDLNN